MRITDDHIDNLRTHGYMLVEDFLTTDELQACRGCLARYFPSPERYAAAPERYQRLPRFIDFPFGCDALNEVTVHPELISFLERLLGTAELRLGESLLQAKYVTAGAESASTPDEQMHCDAWGPNQLVYPRDDGAYRQVPMILYYSNVHEDLGPTCIVSQQLTVGHPLLPDPPDDGSGIRQVVFTRESAPELYEHERPVLARAGSLLVMSARTFHRGSAMRRPGGARFVQFITYRSARATWMRAQMWPPAAPRTDTRELHRFITRASPQQREILGFPPPGDEYWNEETLAGVAARYPGMDMTPYRTGA